MAIKASEREGKRHPLSLRVTADVRKGLEAVASASGRSLTQEAELRLEQSFRDDAAFGGHNNRRLAMNYANRMQTIEGSFGEQFTDSDNGDLRTALIDAFGEELDALRSDLRLAKVMRLMKAYAAKYPPAPGVSLLWPGTMAPEARRPGIVYEEMDEAKLNDPKLLEP